MARFVCLLVAFSLSCAGCRDPEAERFAHARASYESLVARGVPADDSAFADVLSELDAVTSASAHHAEAQRLARAVRVARGPHVRTPLALAPTPGSRPEALEAALAACARLAQLAGADGGINRHALEALEACRRRAERLELQLSHGHDDDDDAGAPHE